MPKYVKQGEVLMADPSVKTEEPEVLLVCTDGTPTVRIGPYPDDIRKDAPRLSFAPVGGMDEYGRVRGQLYLTPTLWREWFEGKELHPACSTLGRCVKWLLETKPSIFLACPICDFFTKEPSELEKHIERHKKALGYA